MKEDCWILFSKKFGGFHFPIAAGCVLVKFYNLDILDSIVEFGERIFCGKVYGPSSYRVVLWSSVYPCVFSALVRAGL